MEVVAPRKTRELALAADDERDALSSLASEAVPLPSALCTVMAGVALSCEASSTVAKASSVVSHTPEASAVRADPTNPLICVSRSVVAADGAETSSFEANWMAGMALFCVAPA